jgi:hypothetical protein
MALDATEFMTIAVGERERTGGTIGKVAGSGLLEIQLHSVGRPRSDTTTEEILILSPNRQIEQQCACDDRPVIRISQVDAAASLRLIFLIETAIDSFNDLPDLTQH